MRIGIYGRLFQRVETRGACFLIREIVRIKKNTESLRSLSGEVAYFVVRKEELAVYCHFDGCISSFQSSFSLFYNTFKRSRTVDTSWGY